jgi:hypothetical protein
MRGTPVPEKPAEKQPDKPAKPAATAEKAPSKEAPARRPAKDEKEAVTPAVKSAVS